METESTVFPLLRTTTKPTCPCAQKEKEMNPIGVVATIVVGSLIGLVIISYTYEDSEPPPVHAKTFLQQCAVEEANAYLPIPGDQPGNYGPQEFVVTVKDASSMASLRDFMREAYKCELGSLAIHIMVVPQGGSK